MSVVCAAVILVLLAMLALRSRREQGDMLQRSSICLCKMMSRSSLLKGRLKWENEQVQQCLVALHPGKSGRELLTDYRVGKVRMVLLILWAGGGLTVCGYFAGLSGGVRIEDGMLVRGPEDRTVTLQAVGQEETSKVRFREELELEVSSRRLNREELEAAYQELVGLIDQRIMAGNASLGEVREDLYLPEQVEGYPFDISWSSDHRALVSADGTVCTDDLEEAVTVTLEAAFIYEDTERKHCWQVTLQPPVRSAEEQLQYLLKKQSVEAEAAAVCEDRFVLPGSVSDQNIRWSVKREDSGMPILLLVLAAAAGVYCLKDRDLQGELSKRRELIRQEYPFLVSKYGLYLGAGMTVRSAFQKICADHYSKGLPEHPLYEEMQYACNELQAGVSEARVYENFGRRTGVQEYARLCTLLAQNLKKGNSTLIRRLKEEAGEALQENVHAQKRRGEEAGTGLLLPMVMLLLMVLVMIMLPAFWGLSV